MKAPYFKLEQSEEAEIVSEILLSDKTPRRYIRSRAPRCVYVRRSLPRYNYFGVQSDGNTLEAFQNPKKISFRDELYVLYDKDGLPVCVSVSESGVRVLHKGGYYIVTAKKVKRYRSPRKLYLAYLDMFPQSALNMDAFVFGRKQYFLAPENCLYDSVWTAATEVGNGLQFSVNAAYSGVQIWKLYKILFELDKNYDIKTVYSAVGKSCGKYVTRAEVTDTGDSVISKFEKALNGFPYAENMIKEIL